jgi:hypothetical protein
VADGPLPPAQDITVYRGELADAAETGIAWSASLDVATDYARRYATAGPTRVLQATATPESVLGRFTLEDEFVVVPDLLTGTVSLGGFPHFTLPLLA